MNNMQAESCLLVLPLMVRPVAQLDPVVQPPNDCWNANVYWGSKTPGRLSGKLA